MARITPSSVEPWAVGVDVKVLDWDEVSDDAVVYAHSKDFGVPVSACCLVVVFMFLFSNDSNVFVYVHSNDLAVLLYAFSNGLDMFVVVLSNDFGVSVYAR